MVLSTFGAIMGFAAEWAGQTGETFKTLAQKTKVAALKETLLALAAEEMKNRSLMEKTRRENVTEMILEPVAGLQQEDYAVNLQGMDQTEDTGLLKIALLLQERERQFFRDASLKVPLPEVARIFRKIAQKKEENLTHLQSLGLNQ
jgi:hypothetical protein